EPSLFFLPDQTQTHQDPRWPRLGKEGGHYARRFPQKRTEVSMMSRQLCRGRIKDQIRCMQYQIRAIEQRAAVRKQRVFVWPKVLFKGPSALLAEIIRGVHEAPTQTGLSLNPTR